MEVPRHWRLKKQRYSLTGEICGGCRTPLFPPRAVCPYCGGDNRNRLSVQEQPALSLEERMRAAEAPKSR